VKILLRRNGSAGLFIYSQPKPLIQAAFLLKPPINTFCT
jgi:hypothetical protein